MPQIPIIRTQSMVSGASANFGNGGAANEVIAGVGSAGGMIARNVMQRQAEEKAAAEKQRAEQKALIEKQRADEANLFIINASSRVRARAQEAMATATQNGSLPGITDRLLKDFDRWGEEEGGSAPEKAKAGLAQHLATIRGQIHERAFGIETAAREQKIVSDFSDGLDNDRRLSFADPGQFQQLLVQRLALVSTLSIPEAERQKLARASRESLSLEAASALAERNPDAFLERAGVAGAKTGKDGKPLPSDPAAAAERVKNDPILSNMDPGQLRQVVDRATLLKVQRDTAIAAEQERRARQAEIVAERREREANQAYTILSGWARDGVVADPVSAKPLLDKLAGTPYQAAYMESVRGVQGRTAAAMQSVAAQQQQLTSLYGQRNQSGTSPQLELEIKEREQILAATRRDYDDDALTGGVKRGLIKLSPIDVNVPVSELGVQLQSRLPAASEMSLKAGRPVSPLTTAEADSVGKQLQAMAPEDKANTIALLSSQVPAPQMLALAKQLAPKDRGLYLAATLGAGTTDAGKPASRLVLLGQEALRREGKGDNSKLMRDEQLRVSEVVGGMFSGQLRDDVVEAAALIQLGKKLDGQSATPRKSVEMALGGPLIEHAGKTVPAPPGMTVDRFRDALPAAGKKVVEGLPDGKVYTRSGVVPAKQFLAELPQAELLPAGQGRYFVRAGAGVALDANGKEIVIEVR